MNRQLQEEQIQILKAPGRPVVIWGTLMAGQMAFEVCRVIGATVSAFGDNNIEKQGCTLRGIKILSTEDVKRIYPDAIIMLGIFGYETEQMICRKLKGESKGFTFISSSWITYFYEVLVKRRRISDKEKLWKVQNNVFHDTEWRYEIDRKVIQEYRYRVTDLDMEDLKRTVSSVYGIKNLCLVIRSEELTDTVLNRIEEVIFHGVVGHMILVTDGKMQLVSGIGEHIQGLFFYVKVQRYCSMQFLEGLQHLNVLYEVVDFPDIFFENPDVKDRNITEQLMYDAVKTFIGEKTDRKVFDQKKPILIVQLFHGLANQMLIYLFGRFLEKYSGKKVVFDDTILAIDISDPTAYMERIGRWCPDFSSDKVEEIVNETKKRNSFFCFSRAEVAEVFRLPICLLSDYFNMESWQVYLHKVKRELMSEYAQPFPLGQILIKAGVDVTVMQDSQMPVNFLNVSNCFCFDTHILGWPFDNMSVTKFIVSYNKSSYYMGVWTMGRIRDWLFNNREYVRKTFRFCIPEDERNTNYIKLIHESEAVMIHIRRGDFAKLGYSVNGQYVKDSVTQIMKSDQTGNIKFFVFSDDLDWCKNNIEELGLDGYSEKTVFVEGNSGKNSYLDMYLMSLGKILIPSPNSTFSYMALLLSSTMEKCIDGLQYEYFYRHNMVKKVKIEDVSNA